MPVIKGQSSLHKRWWDLAISLWLWGIGKVQESWRKELGQKKECQKKRKSSGNSLKDWFGQNKGKGWVNCKTGGPCGRKSKKSGGAYPACRPTMAQCKSKSWQSSNQKRKHQPNVLIGKKKKKEKRNNGQRCKALF